MEFIHLWHDLVFHYTALGLRGQWQSTIIPPTFSVITQEMREKKRRIQLCAKREKKGDCHAEKRRLQIC